MGVTIKKIAEICGISRGTVDRVLNSRGKVKPETEKLVRKVADEFGYTPNPAGKALSARKKNLVVGVLLTSEGNPFFDEVIRGIQAAEKEYRAYGMQVLMKTMRGYEVEQQCALLDEMKGKINALIINPISEPRIVKKINELVDSGIFIVTVNNDIADSKRACYVGSNYINGGETACGIMGLFTKGKAKIGLLTGSVKILGHNQRIAGFKNVMKKKYPDFQILDFAETNDDDVIAFEATMEMLKKHPDINALFVAAAGVYGVCRAVMSLQRQGKITIVSFDSTPNTVEMMRKKVINVTICQHPYTQGHKSMQVVFSYLVNGVEPATTQHIMKNEIKILENL